MAEESLVAFVEGAGCGAAYKAVAQACEGSQEQTKSWRLPKTPFDHNRERDDLPVFMPSASGPEGWCFSAGRIHEILVRVSVIGGPVVL